MPKSVTKVVYKPDAQSTEFMVMVNPAEVFLCVLRLDGDSDVRDFAVQEMEGGRSIPLAEVVDSFEIFCSTQGSQGYLGRPSKQQLENLFGTSKDVEVVKALLEKGKEHSGEAIHSRAFSINATRGSAVLDSKGKGLTGI
ncbi:DUF1960-domain-containing protein [Imleria badia]|nr:DUF1960-domain-containing protein [Imleria badia]